MQGKCQQKPKVGFIGDEVRICPFGIQPFAEKLNHFQMTYSLYLSHLKSVKMQSFELESGISSCFVLICSNLIGSQLKWATEVNLKKILKVNLLKKWVGNGLKMYFRAQKCSWPKEPFFGLAAFNYSMRFAPSEKGKSLESHGVLTPILHSL